ncbi:MAG TPA: hypothetical protein VJM47_03260 [Nitrosospira sp.]|nr:hypothetical protein [Nitrosospira sp.]
MTDGGSKNPDKSGSVADKSKQAAHRVRLPGFITDEEIGLGDVIKRTNAYLGIKPCRGCEQRAAALNRWLAFTPRARK